MSWGLQQLLKTSPRLELVESVPDLRAAGEETAQRASVVVVDLSDSADVPDLVRFVSLRVARVLVLTSLQEAQSLDQAILAGLHGVVRKNESPGALLTAIEKVHEGELWLDRGAAGRIFMELTRQKSSEHDDPERAKIALLTLRERQAIAALIADTAAPAKVVASRLCMSEHTLRNHLTSIYSKLNLTNRLDLYAFATRNQIEKHAPR
jgi:DNA-binding NarL/FixJ family response regulator